MSLAATTSTSLLHPTVQPVVSVLVIDELVIYSLTGDGSGHDYRGDLCYCKGFHEWSELKVDSLVQYGILSYG